MTISFKTALAGAALLFTSAMLTPAQATTDPSPTQVQIEQSGTLRVGMSTFAPWAMRDKQGTLIGFELDVARRLATDNGWQVEFVPTAWDGIIPSLLAKKYDVIIGGLTITPEREKSVRFTRPYSHSGVQLAASSQLAKEKKTVADFNQRGVILAVRRGASPVQVAKENFPKATLRQFDDESQVFQEVLNGRAHGALSSSPKPEQEALRHPDALFMPFSPSNWHRAARALPCAKGMMHWPNSSTSGSPPVRPMAGSRRVMTTGSSRWPGKRRSPTPDATLHQADGHAIQLAGRYHRTAAGAGWPLAGQPPAYRGGLSMALA